MSVPSDPVATPPASRAPSPEDETALQEILGYLNFSNGKPDTRFQQRINRFVDWLVPGNSSTDEFVPPLVTLLEDRLEQLRGSSPAFRDSAQATAVLRLVFKDVIPAYRRHHADLLFHLTPADFLQPLFVARVFEATLAAGGPWEERERIVHDTLLRLNDFLGHRPVAVLHSGQQMQPYDHERFRPVPLYIRGVGAAAGACHDLIESMLAVLSATPPDMLAAAHFDLARLDELALDVRAYDHSHPVYKRTNYTFGEWDPHNLDVSGRYRRFVIRKIILDALFDWMEQAQDLTREEKLYEASAVLTGTILMASAVSGSGPDTHDSNVSLTSLLPRIARQRDAFYLRLLQTLTGKLAARLRREAEAMQQPFGRIRQHLNLFLAHYACRQMQRGHLARLYARMGFSAASREQALVIPSTAARFITEIQWRVTAAHRSLDAGALAAAADLLPEMEDLLQRGIACGALVDPWNILGFQGHFPLFIAREDSVADQRVEDLLSVMEQIFLLYSRVCCEAAAAGESALGDRVAAGFRELADFWDRFATTTVSDLPAIYGRESCSAALDVMHVLHEWNLAGEEAGDIAFWKKHVGRLQSTKAYAMVVVILLRKHDLLAAMNLLLQWLSQGEQIALEAGPYSYHALVLNWMGLAVGNLGERPDAEADWPTVSRFFDYLEANAGDYLAVPSLDAGAGGLALGSGAGLEGSWGRPDETSDERILEAGVDPDEESELDDDDLFGAAYDNVTFRDSAQDGQIGDTLEGPDERHETDLDLIAHGLDQRLRFLVTVSQLWKLAAVTFPGAPHASAIARWLHRDELLLSEMARLVETLAAKQPAEPSGDPDSLVEYDRQMHVKLGLTNAIISAQVSLHEAARTLRCALPEDPAAGEARSWERAGVRLTRLVMAGDREAVRRMLPTFLKELSRRPLLYVPLDKGGRPRDILAARNLQSMIRLFLTQLPRLGLLRETWHLLRTAYVMERTSPPGGMSITEFDRLLGASLHSTLECLIQSAGEWNQQEFADDRLVELVGEVTEVYLQLWLKHSHTMRLSSVESLADSASWKRVKSFIRTYGSDMFHARVLSLGNLRAVVQRGVESYLDYLIENEDPLHPIRLVHDLDVAIPRDEAVAHLELIFRCIVEKFDRYIEYNTTTTQSDYGEQLYCLLDFLRLEAGYERQAWNLMPLVLAHEVLSRSGKVEAAAIWQKVLQDKTAGFAKTHLKKLRRLEKQYGVRLPSITDRLSERFIKPLALDRILALVAPAVREAKSEPGQPALNFERLKAEVEQYLVTSSGSAQDLQPWLQDLEAEVQNSEAEPPAIDEDESPIRAPFLPIDHEELREQLDTWEKPLGGA